MDKLKYSVLVDDEGVWISCGILPWNKGIYGLNWRDISDATFRIGFLSWALKSYSVTINHRYTKSSEIALKHIKQGQQLVKDINRIVQEKNLY